MSQQRSHRSSFTRENVRLPFVSCSGPSVGSEASSGAVLPPDRQSVNSLSFGTKLWPRFGREKRRLPPLPQSNVLFHESRYKTELCRQFEELGDCEYGDRCLFAHGMDELKNIPHRHPKFKTEKEWFCSFGPRCSFIHEKPDAVKMLMQLQVTVRRQLVNNEQNVTEEQFRPDRVMDRLMRESALLPASDARRLPVFTNIAP